MAKRVKENNDDSDKDSVAKRVKENNQAKRQRAFDNDSDDEGPAAKGLKDDEGYYE